MVDKACEASTK